MFNFRETLLRRKLRGDNSDFDPTTVTIDMNGVMHAADNQDNMETIRVTARERIYINEIRSELAVDGHVTIYCEKSGYQRMLRPFMDFPIPDEPETIEVRVDDEFLNRIHESKEYKELLESSKTLLNFGQDEPEPAFTVLKPAHYNSTKISTWDIVEDWKLTYHIGNALKYIQRAGKKPGADWFDDMGKAIESIQEEIRLRRKGNG